MQELISITTGGQGSPVVSARELHRYLGSKQQFADWIKNRIATYRFSEGTDYVLIRAEEVIHKSMKNPSGGRPEVDYALTLDMAKELSMVERTVKGQQARQYFIDSEKALHQNLIIQANQLLAQQQEARITRLEQQLTAMIEAQQQAARSLLELPRSAELVPEETTKSKIRRLVNGYCAAKGVSQQVVWRKVYSRLLYRYHVNIRAHKKSDRESWLDVAERKGHLEKLYAIVSAELIFNPDEDQE